MVVSWAYVYEHPDTDPVVDRVVIDRSGQRTLLVPVPEASMAADVARALVEEGVELIELCGGLPLPLAAAVTSAVGDGVPVGHVTFAVDSVRGAAAYSERFGTGQADRPS
ncbi:hypothetical protein SAMN05660350_00249 [Geodermatophilus obscurus]|uniref:Uncharacterized protein n=1 Tax=Geodermatophilus obscurus TaxID=1861 RepID=A0A1M7RYG9_9ACTN|nr:DUF6506 family protein [Geodermatophilus obscurus]SHN51082.1 hypothetical protein SAMN05660350_00249 [Geodermatophilus obscurus]